MSGPNWGPNDSETDVSSLRGNPRGAVEHHVLEEVGDSRLVFILVERPGVDNETQFRPAPGGFILSDVVPEPVVEGTHPHVGIDG